jgi:hypothetical protein
MDLSPFVSSDPAARRDGWSPERKLRFLRRLASNGNVRSACAAVGMSREAAYTLRRRDALFARGWAAALLLAREAGVELLADLATEGIEEEVWHRGEHVGTKRRFDARLLLAHLARLDRMVEEADERTANDAVRFEEVLACVAEVEVPEELRVDDEPLPLDREAALDMVGDEAAQDVADVWSERAEANEDGELEDEDYEQYRDERADAVAFARAEAAARWDAWFAGACERVDAMLASAGETSARTVSEVSGSSPAAVDASRVVASGADG